jgi:hypothetical protein
VLDARLADLADERRAAVAELAVRRFDHEFVERSREGAFWTPDAFRRIVASERAGGRVEGDARLDAGGDAVTAEATERHMRSVAQ